jgi:hypothetical protein
MASDAKQLRLSEASVVAWEKCLNTSIGSYTLEVCIAFSVRNDQVTMELAVVVNGTRYSFTQEISGNQCFTIPIIGFELETCISNWTISQNSVAFTLKAWIVALIKIKLYEGEVKIPLGLPDADELATFDAVQVATPQDLVHLLSLVASVQAQPDSPHDGCNCGSAETPATVPTGCPPNNNEIGKCYEPNGTPIPGRFNCAACCGLRAAGYWVSPTNVRYNCK